MPELTALLGAPAVSYGKGAIVGVNGEAEHGGACVHPMLGRPMRAAIGGGGAVIPSKVKGAGGRAALGLPPRAQGEPWAFPHLQTLKGEVGGAPRPGEIG